MPGYFGSLALPEDSPRVRLSGEEIIIPIGHLFFTVYGIVAEVSAILSDRHFRRVKNAAVTMLSGDPCFKPVDA
jgi:hypothetical protein